MIIIWIVRILQVSALILCFAGVLTNRRLEERLMDKTVKRGEIKRLRDLRDLFLGLGLMCFLVSLPPLY